AVLCLLVFRPGVRPVAALNDPSIVVSGADSRVTVCRSFSYNTLTLETQRARTRPRTHARAHTGVSKRGSRGSVLVERRRFYCTEAPGLAGTWRYTTNTRAHTHRHTYSHKHTHRRHVPF